ncbi:hypothetical protein AC630_24265 [Bradyrhizobium sp. AS23.2]|nr:hypothetical protein AC630_24265 [Bradyrhizobium sp. AS23.2]
MRDVLAAQTITERRRALRVADKRTSEQHWPDQQREDAEARADAQGIAQIDWTQKMRLGLS